MHRLVGLSCLVSLVGGCSGSGLNSGAADMAEVVQAQPDLAPAPPDLSLPHRDPTDHPQLPQVTNFGGPTLNAMEIVTIVWQGDEALGARVERFHGWMLGSSEYWTSALGEYGVGVGKSVGLFVMPEVAPAKIDDSQFDGLIKKYIASGLFPAPNANTTYAFVVPKKTQSTQCYGGGCSYGCQDYGGYHSESQQTGLAVKTVPYEVNLQCPGFSAGDDFNSLTDVLSHEAGEVATDPHPFSHRGWVNDTIPVGGEVGDLCVGLSATFHASFDVPDAGAQSEDYVVTRLYSQKAAFAGVSDPCVPAPKRPYFNVAVDPPDWTVTLDAAGKATATAKIEPYSYGDVGLIKWALEGQPGQGIVLTPSKGSAMAGDTILLQVDVTGAQPGTYPISLFTQAAKGGSNQWFSSITVQ